MIASAGNPIVDHAWGVSHGADRVFAQISGMAPSSRPWERLFVIYQAYIDDSYTAEGVFVLAGYVASAMAWAEFSREWELLLPLTRRGNSGKQRFKMTEMAHDMEKVPLFYDVIEKHVLLAVSCKINLLEFEKAKDRVWVEDSIIKWNFFHSPINLAYRALLDNFHSKLNKEVMAKYLPLETKVDFYFDRHSASGELIDAWDEYIKTRPEDIQDFYGAMPRFEDDEEFLPLQAADFWAWWVRKAYEDDTIDDLVSNNNFRYWIGEKRIPKIIISLSEDKIVANLMESLRLSLSWSRPIYDANYHPKPIEQPPVPRHSLAA